MATTYTGNPKLKTIRENYPGTPMVNGKFVNEDRDFGAGFSKVLQWMFTANPHRAEKKKNPFIMEVQPNPSIFHEGPDAFVWLGHSTFIFRLNNRRIITDPILYDLPGIKRLFRAPFHTHDIINIDYILLSHSHRDHFDRKTFSEIVRRNPDVTVYCSLKMQPLLKREGARKITEAGWYQELPQDETGIRFYFLPAKHWNRRYVHDTNRELWGAFRIETAQHSVYFAGDTAYHTHFKDSAALFPKTDYAFMPIGAYKPSFMMKSSHTSPQEAVQAFHDLNATTFVPMHYGTYDLSDEPLGEPIQLMHDMKHSGVFSGRLAVPVPGAVNLF
ncbi:MAG: MBL fold metallo-hydrolase [Bacteroidia bacterium]